MVEKTRNKEISNEDLRVTLESSVSNFRDMEFKWIRGHNGLQRNKYANVLA